MVNNISFIFFIVNLYVLWVVADFFFTFNSIYIFCIFLFVACVERVKNISFQHSLLPFFSSCYWNYF